MDSLTHLGPPVTDLDSPRLVANGRHEVHDRLGHLTNAVAQAGVLEPEAEANRLAVDNRSVVSRLDLIEAGFRSPSAIVHHLARSPLVARLDDIALAHLPTGDPDHRCQPIEYTFHRELRLVGSESAKCATDQVVGPHGNRLDVDRPPAIRTARVPSCPFENLHPDARVGARISYGADLQRGQPAIGVAPGPVFELNRMALGVHPQALFTTQRALDGLAQLPGRE